MHCPGAGGSRLHVLRAAAVAGGAGEGAEPGEGELCGGGGGWKGRGSRGRGPTAAAAGGTKELDGGAERNSAEEQEAEWAGGLPSHHGGFYLTTQRLSQLSTFSFTSVIIV